MRVTLGRAAVFREVGPDRDLLREGLAQIATRTDLPASRLARVAGRNAPLVDVAACLVDAFDATPGDRLPGGPAGRLVVDAVEHARRILADDPTASGG